MLVKRWAWRALRALSQAAPRPSAEGQARWIPLLTRVARSMSTKASSPAEAALAMHEMQSPMMRSVRQLLQGWAWGSHDVDISVDGRRRPGRRRGAVLVKPDALLPQ